jgi:hypothetical protein
MFVELHCAVEDAIVAHCIVLVRRIIINPNLKISPNSVM